jgi:hypothetical protein
MVEDGGAHDIVFSVSRSTNTITFFLGITALSFMFNLLSIYLTMFLHICHLSDGKIMSSQVHEDVSKFPMNAYGPVTLGCVAYPDEVPMSQRVGSYMYPGIIGEYSNIVIHTDTSPPFTERYVSTGFNEEYGYGSCVPYSLDLVDEGLCANYNDIGDPIYVTPHGFPVRL